MQKINLLLHRFSIHLCNERRRCRIYTTLQTLWQSLLYSCSAIIINVWQKNLTDKLQQMFIFHLYFSALKLNLLKFDEDITFQIYVLCNNVKQMYLNQKNFHNLQSHLAYLMFTSIRHTICEILVKIQHFRHELSSIMLENSLKKTQYNQKAFHNLQSHLAYQYIKMCLLIRHTFNEIYVPKLECRSFL